MYAMTALTKGYAPMIHSDTKPPFTQHITILMAGLP